MVKIKHIRIFLLTVALLTALFIAVVYYKINYVTYQIDEGNTCTWKSGQLLLGTANNLGPVNNVRVKKSNEKTFLENAADKGKCVYRN